MKTLHPMKVWMAAATTDEQTLLAERAGTSRGQLFQLAGEHRRASSDLAGRIESVTAVMHKASKGRLPKVMRTDLCEACRSCPYASKVLGERAIVSEFPIIEAIKEE